MIGNPDYNAKAYDIACRVPGCPFEEENVSPEIAGTLLVDHIGNPCRLPGEPVFTMRIRSGYEGVSPDRVVRTAEYGWFRPKVPWDEVDETPDEWHERKKAQDSLFVEVADVGKGGGRE